MDTGSIKYWSQICLFLKISTGAEKIIMLPDAPLKDW